MQQNNGSMLVDSPNLSLSLCSTLLATIQSLSTERTDHCLRRLMLQGRPKTKKPSWKYQRWLQHLAPKMCYSDSLIIIWKVASPVSLTSCQPLHLMKLSERLLPKHLVLLTMNVKPLVSSVFVQMTSRSFCRRRCSCTFGLAAYDNEDTCMYCMNPSIVFAFVLCVFLQTSASAWWQLACAVPDRLERDATHPRCRCRPSVCQIFANKEKVNMFPSLIGGAGKPNASKQLTNLSRCLAEHESGGVPSVSETTENANKFAARIGSICGQFTLQCAEAKNKTPWKANSPAQANDFDRAPTAMNILQGPTDIDWGQSDYKDCHVCIIFIFVLFHIPFVFHSQIQYDFIFVLEQFFSFWKCLASWGKIGGQEISKAANFSKHCQILKRFYHCFIVVDPLLLLFMFALLG